jgi:hypothetical protein
LSARTFSKNQIMIQVLYFYPILLTVKTWAYVLSF